MYRDKKVLKLTYITHRILNNAGGFVCLLIVVVFFESYLKDVFSTSYITHNIRINV